MIDLFVVNKSRQGEIEKEIKEYNNRIHKRRMTGSLFVDGTQIKNLQNYRATSDLFNMTLPANNAPGVKAGTTQAVSDDLWVILEPLSKGNHSIHFTGAIIDPTTGTQNYSEDLTYNLTVE